METVAISKSPTLQNQRALIDNLQTLLFKTHSLADALYLSTIGEDHTIGYKNTISNTTENLSELIMEQIRKALVIAEDLDELADCESS